MCAALVTNAKRESPKPPGLLTAPGRMPRAPSMNSFVMGTGGKSCVDTQAAEIERRASRPQYATVWLGDRYLCYTFGELSACPRSA
jgi:hypothetical protein